ncbi:protein of unknown function [Paraburkholderia dioscoreae]|uniref:Uncharacterized protein n=1 Tax=Paraburkholderia dioscoreae TaxID=2604047 RepID=A0A5Q4ZW18_9BURK|nr:protein of unknown function [Paraburkholderia dioscoreae]
MQHRCHASRAAPSRDRIARSSTIVARGGVAANGTRLALNGPAARLRSLDEGAAARPRVDNSTGDKNESTFSFGDAAHGACNERGRCRQSGTRIGRSRRRLPSRHL